MSIHDFKTAVLGAGDPDLVEPTAASAGACAVIGGTIGSLAGGVVGLFAGAAIGAVFPPAIVNFASRWKPQEQDLS